VWVNIQGRVSLNVTVENKKMSKRKPNWTDREKVALLEEYEKRKVIFKANFARR
jgi:hypothetical protein